MQKEPTEDLWLEGQRLHLADKFPEAEAIYTRLLEQNHNNGGLMATLGSLYLQTGNNGLAIHFLESAIKTGLKIPDIYTNLALAYKGSHQVQKSRAAFEKSINEDPSAESLTNYSGMFIECGESKKCADLCERAIAMKYDLPVAHWNLAISLLGDGVWDRAWDEHEWGLKGNCMREDRNPWGVPFWDGTPGKTVVLYGEQGLGDEIMFASMIHDIAKTNPVILECHGRLETLFRKSFPDITVYGTREDKEISWADNHKIDARLSIGSLGKFYRRSREAFPGTPYLKSDQIVKGKKFRVGISWQGGGAKMGRVQKRSVPLPWWKSILNVPDVEFVSLQYMDGSNDLSMMEALGYDIKNMDDLVKAQDYYETARLVASCDLVISVCTSVIHLAGALGVPCWVMTPKFPAWRYQNTGGMPWYRSVRLYRSQDVEQDGWRPVVERIGYDLDKLVHGQKKLQAVG